MVAGSPDSLWHNSDPVVIIDGGHGPEPAVETKTSPGSTQNSEGHTHVKSSKESEEELPGTPHGPRETQGPGQVEGSKGGTKPQTMPEEVTAPLQVTLTDELQQTCPGKPQAKSKEVTASPLMDELQQTRS